jgi:hypothetical protein
VTRQMTRRSRLPSAAGAASGSGDPAAWEAAAEAADGRACYGRGGR